MRVFMAGATITLFLRFQPRKTTLCLTDILTTKLSAMPRVIFARVFASRGAMRSTSPLAIIYKAEDQKGASESVRIDGGFSRVFMK